MPIHLINKLDTPTCDEIMQIAIICPVVQICIPCFRCRVTLENIV